MGNGVDQQLRRHDVEGIVREFELLAVHNGETLNVGEALLADALARLGQHLLRQVDTEHAGGGLVVGERDARAYAGLEDPAANPLTGGNRRATALLEHGTENEIIDRRPAGIGFRNRRVGPLGCRHGRVSRFEIGFEGGTQEPAFCQFDCGLVT